MTKSILIVAAERGLALGLLNSFLTAAGMSSGPRGRGRHR